MWSSRVILHLVDSHFNIYENVLKSGSQFTGILWRRRTNCSFSLSWHWARVSGFCFSLASFSAPFSLAHTLLSFKILNITCFACFAQKLVSVQNGNIRHWPSIEAKGKNLDKICPPLFLESWWHWCAIKTYPRSCSRTISKTEQLWDSDWAHFRVCWGLQCAPSPDCNHGHC